MKEDEDRLEVVLSDLFEETQHNSSDYFQCSLSNFLLEDDVKFGFHILMEWYFLKEEL